MTVPNRGTPCINHHQNVCLTLPYFTACGIEQVLTGLPRSLDPSSLNLDQIHHLLSKLIQLSTSTEAPAKPLGPASPTISCTEQQQSCSAATASTGTTFADATSSSEESDPEAAQAHGVQKHASDNSEGPGSSSSSSSSSSERGSKHGNDKAGSTYSWDQEKLPVVGLTLGSSDLPRQAGSLHETTLAGRTALAAPSAERSKASSSPDTDIAAGSRMTPAAASAEVSNPACSSDTSTDRAEETHVGANCDTGVAKGSQAGDEGCYAGGGAGKLTAPMEPDLDDMLNMLEKEFTSSSSSSTSSSRRHRSEACGLLGRTATAAGRGSDCVGELPCSRTHSDLAATAHSNASSCLNCAGDGSTATAAASSCRGTSATAAAGAAMGTRCTGDSDCTEGGGTGLADHHVESSAVPVGTGQISVEGALDEMEDNCLVLDLEVDDEVDLNKVPDYELKLAKVRGRWLIR